MYKYFLEYGRHDLDNGYNSIELAFDPEKTQTDVRSMNLVALRINTTHASILLQVNGPMHFPLASSRCRALYDRHGSSSYPACLGYPKPTQP